MDQYGLHTNTYHAFPVECAIETAGRLSLPSIELSAVKGWTEHVMSSFPQKRIAEIEEKLRSLGLAVPVLSAHSDLSMPERVEDFLVSIQLARRLGCRTIVTSCGEAHFGRETLNERALLDGLQRALDVCAAEGLQLALETHGAYGSGARLMELLVKVGNPLLGIAYDTANVTRHGHVYPEDDLRLCAGFVKHVHLKDKTGAFDGRTFTALGEGWIDFPTIFSILDCAGYDGMYALEVEYFEPQSPTRERVDRDVRASFQYLCSLGRLKWEHFAERQE